MEIREFAFSQTGLRSLREHSKGQNCPVVYLINNDKPNKSELYVGETTSAGGRFQQHLNNPDRHSLDTIRFIFDDQFNKSAILDIEQTLIQMFMADRKFVLQNRNGGQSCKHDYYQRALYQAKVDEIWNELNRALLTNQDASTIRNSNLFKYSPFNTLTPEQEQVSQDILSNAIDCLESGETGTSVLNGKAGTGKSIVLIHMMYTLMSAMNVTYNNEDLTPDEQFELGLRISLSNKISEYVRKHGNLKIAFVDEAHRLARRKGITSYGSFDDACAKLWLNPMTATQLDMIQKRSKYSVVVYDGCQTVKASDLTPEQFQQSVGLRKRMPHYVTLHTQMRCEGGHSYLEYLDNIFQVNQKDFQTVKNYDFKIWEDPNMMIEDIRSKEKSFSLCRVVAGYSWEWKSKGCVSISEAVRNGLQDIELDGRKYVWNMSNQEWILREGAVNEIGCVHTTQGYDLNYVAVIFGREIDYDEESDSIVIDRGNFYDSKVKDGVDDEALKQYIINSYKVMMTRGIKGCYVYACNPGLRNYLKRFINQV